MKVVAFNGSPHKEGNTYHALRMVLEELEKNPPRRPARPAFPVMGPGK